MFIIFEIMEDALLHPFDAQFISHVCLYIVVFDNFLHWLYDNFVMIVLKFDCIE